MPDGVILTVPDTVVKDGDVYAFKKWKELSAEENSIKIEMLASKTLTAQYHDGIDVIVEATYGTCEWRFGGIFDSGPNLADRIVVAESEYANYPAYSQLVPNTSTVDFDHWVQCEDGGGYWIYYARKQSFKIIGVPPPPEEYYLPTTIDLTGKLPSYYARALKVVVTGYYINQVLQPGTQTIVVEEDITDYLDSVYVNTTDYGPPDTPDWATIHEEVGSIQQCWRLKIWAALYAK